VCGPRARLGGLVLWPSAISCECPVLRPDPVWLASWASGVWVEIEGGGGCGIPAAHAVGARAALHTPLSLCPGGHVAAAQGRQKRAGCSACHTLVGVCSCGVHCGRLVASLACGVGGGCSRTRGSRWQCVGQCACPSVVVRPGSPCVVWPEARFDKRCDCHLCISLLVFDKRISSQL
jgi:hypothetical protein